MFLYVAATFVLWALSGVITIGAALAFAAGAGSGRRARRWLSTVAITLTRGLPTSLLVVAAGLISIRIPAQPWMPNLFPGTEDGAVPVAWAVLLALAVGSAGHFAVIFHTAYTALGRARMEQSVVLGMSRFRRMGLLSREVATAAIPPTASRLVHHLHNTAFAALFPVADLFGWIENGANATFNISRFVLAGGAGYVGLSGLIWASFKILEVWLRRRTEPARPAALPITALDGAR